MTTSKKKSDKPSTKTGPSPQQQQHAGRDEREANRQNGNPANAGQKDGAPGGAQSRRGLEEPPRRSGAGQVDQKPGSADAGVHGGTQDAELTQGSQRQKQDLQGDGSRDTWDDPKC